MGGGVYFEGNSTTRTLTITDSTIGGPTAPNIVTAGNGGTGGSAGSSGAGGAGGGVGGAGGLAEGGGIYDDFVSATLTSDTIASNTLTGGAGGAGGTGTGTGTAGASGAAGSATGGGYFNQASAGDVNNVVNTIIDLNSAATNPDVTGAFTSQGHNIIGPVGTATGFTAAGDQVGVSAANLKLGPLANNGGPVPTDALLPGSVAIAAGDTTLLAGQTTDERGYPRTFNGTVDVGAYQTGPVFVPLQPIANQTVSYLQNVLQATVPATSTIAIAGSSAYFLNQSLHFTFAGSYFLNFLGRNEKWFQGQSNSFHNPWYFITPAGQIFAWDGTNSGAGSTPVGPLLDPVYYAYPDLIYQATPAMLDLVLKQRLSLVFIGNFFQNFGGRNEKWLSGIVNQYGNVWYFLDTTGAVLCLGRHCQPGHRHVARQAGSAVLGSAATPL